MTSVQDDMAPPKLEPAAARSGGPLDHVAALVLLAGSVRASHWTAALGRSVLDLPVASGQSLLGQWHAQALALAEALRRTSLPMRVLLDHLSLVPAIPAGSAGVSVQLERDRFDFRGSGGVLHDIVVDYRDDQYILVANAASMVGASLTSLAQALAGPAVDISIHSLPDGTPSGLMLVRCGSLRNVASVGFVDMKEQALPAIARKHRVAVVRRPADCRAIRSFQDYLRALREEHRRRRGDESATPFAEDWRSSFAIVENAIAVESSACIHDSVVLEGARVEARAVVVRSVVGAGGVVRRGQSVVDQLVVPPGGRR